MSAGEHRRIGIYYLDVNTATVAHRYSFGAEPMRLKPLGLLAFYE